MHFNFFQSELAEAGLVKYFFWCYLGEKEVFQEPQLIPYVSIETNY